MNVQKRLLDAVAAHKRGDLDTAEAGYRAILRSQPRHFDAMQLLGAVLVMRGQYAQAKTTLARAIVINGRVAAVHNNLGNAVLSLGNAEESLAHFDRALALDPNLADARNNRGNAHDQLGLKNEALADYERVLAQKPDHVNALQKSARILVDAGRLSTALERDARALSVAPPTVDAYLRSGNIRFHCKRPAEALEQFDKVLAVQPDHVQATINRAAALEILGRTRDALDAFDRALALNPKDVRLLTNKAALSKNMGHIDEARGFYRQALAVRPDDPDANANYGMTLLLRGDFAGGWPAYEHRWRQPHNAGKKPVLDFPAWKGEPLDGHRILVFAEQGLGDVIQFSRYLTLLRSRGADVSFLVTSKLHAVLSMAFPCVTLFGDVDAVRESKFDFQTAMMSLPLAFGTRVETIPANVPYLKSEPERVARWRQHIGANGFKVGICWQGKADVSVDPERSFPLSLFEPLAPVPNVRLISLQKNEGVDQLANAGFPVETLGEEFDAGADAFVDTIAAMECLDLVITPDTSIAHVAGALGRPVWVPLKNVPDWRWMLSREDSPWYPAMRLFRQAAPGDWAGVFNRMREALAEIVF